MALVTLENLTLKYEGKVVLNKVNFEINEGDFICVVGENGTGKSTLIKSLVGLKNIDDGNMTFGGLKKSDIGYIAQQNNIQDNFPASVFEVAMQGLENSKTLSFFYGREEKALVLNALKKLGLEHLCNTPINELSGGLQRRVLLCRALMSSKKLIVMDEPTSSLDNLSAKEIYKTTKQLCEDEKMAAVVVLHDLDNAINYANKILLIKNDSYKMLTPSEYLKEAGI